MRAKSYLDKLRYLDLDIDSRIKEQDNLRNSLFGSKPLKEISVQEARTGKMDDTYVRLMEMSVEIDEKINQLVKLKQVVSRQIDELDDPISVLILRMRYINQESWVSIQKKINKSERQMYYLHGQALQLFGQKHNFV